MEEVGGGSTADTREWLSSPGRVPGLKIGAGCVRSLALL